MVDGFRPHGAHGLRIGAGDTGQIHGSTRRRSQAICRRLLASDARDRTSLLASIEARLLEIQSA